MAYSSLAHPQAPWLPPAVGRLTTRVLPACLQPQPQPLLIRPPAVPWSCSPARGLDKGQIQRSRCRHSFPASSTWTCQAVAGTALPDTFELTASQKSEYEEKGYLVLEGFGTGEECRGMQQRMGVLLDAFDPYSSSGVFSSRNQTRLTNSYFLHSARNISFFFEEDAFDEQGALKQPKALSINKVGHALHDLDPVFRAFSRSPKVASLVHSLGFTSPLPVQSMYIFKQPGIGGEVVPHQDSSFLFTSPPSCVGLWLALEEATVENGCLWAQPGSHKGSLSRRFVRTPEGGVAWDSPEPSVPPYDLSHFVPLPVPQGALVVLHGQLWHLSYKNESPKSRHAYSVHVIENHNCEYSQDNWLQRRGSQDPPFEPL